MSLKKKGGKPSKKPRSEEFLPESDEYFAYIVDYTSGGAPYIHDYHIMHDFCYSVPKGRVAEDLNRSISGKGAFRRFKGALQRHGIEQNWYRFRDESYKATGKQWCEENGLAWCEAPRPT